MHSRRPWAHAAFDTELQRLKSSADHAGGTLAKGVNEWLLPRWAPIKAIVEATLARKKLSVDDVDTMVQFGKLISASTELSAKVDEVITLADQALAAGRGFAVVASEVRSLAQRSASAAREIKGLIEASVSCVEAGNEQVASAGRAMAEIVESVQSITDSIARIHAAADEQAIGIEQVNGSVSQIEGMTQQNAALVEQSAKVAQSLNQQTHNLIGAIRYFTLAEGAPTS